MAKQPSWYRALPKPIRVGKPRPLTLRRLVDVCDFLKGIPPERRGDAWQYAQRTLDEAAHHAKSVNQVSVALTLLLSIEEVPWQT